MAVLKVRWKLAEGHWAVDCEWTTTETLCPTKTNSTFGSMLRVGSLCQDLSNSVLSIGLLSSATNRCIETSVFSFGRLQEDCTASPSGSPLFPVPLVGFPDLGGGGSVTVLAATVLLSERIQEYLVQYPVQCFEILSFSNPHQEEIHLRIVFAGIVRAIQIHDIVAKKNIADRAVESAVFLLQQPMLLAILCFYRHRPTVPECAFLRPPRKARREAPRCDRTALKIRLRRQKPAKLRISLIVPPTWSGIPSCLANAALKWQGEYLKNIYVGNLDSGTTEAAIRSLFEPHGTVRNLKLMTDRKTGASRGFAFVEMKEPEAVRAIAALNENVVDGRQIDVHEGRTKLHRARTPDAGK